IPNQKKGYVPHHLPGMNPYIREFSTKRGVPPEAAMGGAETIYPEYILKLRGASVAAANPAVRASAISNTVREKTCDIEVLPVQGNVYMIAGAGGNIAVQVGDDGVLMVDTGLEQWGERVGTAIRQLSNKPVRFIVNSSARPDHTGA